MSGEGEEKSGGLENSIAELTQQLGEFREDVRSDIRGLRRDLAVSVEGINERVDALSKDLGERFVHVESKLKKLDKKMKKYSRRYESMEANLKNYPVSGIGGYSAPKVLMGHALREKYEEDAQEEWAY